MSSQAASSIPFTFTAPQQAFRLLELPPELVQSLRSSNPPSLKIKSSTPSTSTPFSKSSSTINNHEQTSTAHLVTPTQSYQIRQVSTSNSVFVTCPSSIPINVPEDDSVEAYPCPPNDNTTSTSLTAIAQVDSILELQPVQYSAETELLNHLPIWVSPDEKDLISDPSHPPQTKDQIFSSIPLPDPQLEVASIALLLFSTATRAGKTIAVQPSPTAALNAWKDILSTALDTSTDLSSFFYPSALLTSNTDTPTNLKASILHHLSHPAETTGIPVFDPDAKTWLQKPKVLHWTGTALLRSLQDPYHVDISRQPSVLREDFLLRWRDLLPNEEWRGDAKLELLGNICMVRADGRVELAPAGLSMTGTGGGPGAGAGDAAARGTVNGAAAAAASGSGAGSGGGAGGDKKRKWHEKFKAQRDAAAAASKKR